MATMAGGRPARQRWSLRLRAPLSFVAVLLVIAVVAGSLMGGRLLADWKRLTTPPAPAAPQTPLQKLEARPLQFQHVAPNGHCPQGPWDANGYGGLGPVHFSGSSVEAKTGWGYYYFDSLFADHPVAGPILVRARDVVTDLPIVFVSENAAGPVIGTDVLDGELVAQHLELVIVNPGPPYAWLFTAGVQHGRRCEGWRIDAPGFTEIVYT